MKFTLKDYQRDAVRDALTNMKDAREDWHQRRRKSAFSLTAVTGAGKTVMAAAAFEALFHGDDDLGFDADPGAVVLWFSDDPSLNEQTRFRLMEASDRISSSSLVVIENSFNSPSFDAGKIYFLNTQKLGKNSLLVRGFDEAAANSIAGDLLPETRPDLRSYTLWDTIQNTIDDPSLTLYLVLDEAHRGMGTPRPADQAAKSTTVQRLINGSGGVPGIPVVWGISATVERFNQAIESAGRHIRLPNVVVDAAKVQESGLIKDSILLDIPDEAGDFDTVLMRRGTDKLKASTEAWAAYSQEQGLAETVVPLMVLQVPNTPDPAEIGRWLDTIFERYPKLPAASVAHVFGDHTTQRFGNRDVPYIEPQRVQDAEWVRVLVAKDAISTGWDCPRAEVMVSFRAASDRTHITQLLGRMVRSPLARRIPGNDRLNAVDCLLPKFNRRTVDEVVDALMHGDDSGPPTGRVLLDYVEIKPNPEAGAAVWATFEALPSQTRPQRGAKPARRLTALAHELAADGILDDAGDRAHAHMHAVLDKFQEAHRDEIETKRKSVLTLDGKTVRADLKGRSRSLDEFWEDADTEAIDDAFRRAARVFSPDIARTYAEHLASKNAPRDGDPDAYLDAILEARVAVAGLGLVTEVQANFDTEADNLAKAWIADFAQVIKTLSDDRKDTYREIIEMSAEPQAVNLAKPASRFEATKAKDSGVETIFPTWRLHLLCDGGGRFPAELRGWERDVVETELRRAGSRFWYRNPGQPGQSSLGVAYLDGTKYEILRPDFLFFAVHDGDLVVDLVDPHGYHLADALPKLRGLAEYAAKHGAAYRRIEAIAEAAGKLRRLDMQRATVRQAVATAHSAKDLYEGAIASDYS